MIGLLLPLHLNLQGAAVPAAAVIARGAAKALPLAVTAVAEVCPNPTGTADVVPLLTQGVADVVR